MATSELIELIDLFKRWSEVLILGAADPEMERIEVSSRQVGLAPGLELVACGDPARGFAGGYREAT